MAENPLLMSVPKVLVAGGNGHFGRLLVDDLRRYADCEVVVAGRNSSLDKALSGVSVAICAAGPFQSLPTTLAELCLQRSVHYIDLADDRNFVRRVHALVPKDKENLPAICPAWSTVSALSGVLTQIAAAGMKAIEAVYIHMAPGNRVPRSKGTIASLLHSVGRPFTVFRGDRWVTVRGWSEPRDFNFPMPIGRQRGYLVDVPDHEFFPELFHARTVEFRTGSELRILNAAVSCLGEGWYPWAGLVQRAAACLGFLGHDWGGVGVEVIGSNVWRRVSVVADSGGQRIAVMPASVMTASLLAGSSQYGLVSPSNWLTTDALHEECRKRGFRLVVEES